MFKTKSHNLLWTLIITWLSVLVIFPHLSGVTFTGSPVMALFVSLTYLSISITLFVALFVLVAIASLIYFIHQGWDAEHFSPRRYLGFFLSLGFWGSLALTSGVFALLSAVSWKITSGMFQSLSFAGFLPALYAAASILVVGAIPSVATNPRRYSTAAFSEWILAEIAKAEAKSKDSAPPASEPLHVDEPKPGTSEEAVVSSWPTGIIVEVNQETPTEAATEVGHSDTTGAEEPAKNATPAPHAEEKVEPTTAPLTETASDASQHPKPPVV